MHNLLRTRYAFVIYRHGLTWDKDTLTLFGVASSLQPVRCCLFVVKLFVVASPLLYSSLLTLRYYISVVKSSLTLRCCLFVVASSLLTLHWCLSVVNTSLLLFVDSSSLLPRCCCLCVVASWLFPLQCFLFVVAFSLLRLSCWLFVIASVFLPLSCYLSVVIFSFAVSVMRPLRCCFLVVASSCLHALLVSSREGG